MIHAQFETIHPFLDGNGRIGRLLITFWLCQQNILKYPLLYLSCYFKHNRLEYYDRLMAVRTKDDWEGWLKFFLKGIAQVSDEAIASAKEILVLRKELNKLVYDNGSLNHQRLLERLFEQPIITVNRASEFLEISYPTAKRVIDDFCSKGILKS